MIRCGMKDISVCVGEVRQYHVTMVKMWPGSCCRQTMSVHEKHAAVCVGSSTRALFVFNYYCLGCSDYFDYF